MRPHAGLWGGTQTPDLGLNVKRHSSEGDLGVSIFPLSQALDHAGEPGRQEEADCPKQANNYEHPQEDAINDHGDVLPVLLHLSGGEQRKEGMK